LNNIRTVKSVIILGMLLMSMFFLYSVHTVSAKDPVYNAKVILKLNWSDSLSEEPIVPRGEVIELPIMVTLEIVTGPRFGYGLLEGYKGSQALIDLAVVDRPSWCYATLKSDLLVTNISEREQASTSLYIHVNENAPAYGYGYVKIQVTCANLGLIKGDDESFTLRFKPAFIPIIKTDFPESTAKEINPNSKAVFPIEVENIGNAQTRVFFEIDGIPDGWSAVVTDSLIIDSTKGSKETAYLTVIPPSGTGYHYDQANIRVKITPTFADNTSFTGAPLYASFIVQNRGFSTNGLEAVLPLFILIIVIIAFVFIIIKRVRSKKDRTIR